MQQCLPCHKAARHVIETVAHRKLRKSQARIQGSRLGRSPPPPALKPTKVTLFTMILYNSEKSIRDIIQKTVSLIRLDYQILLKSPFPPNLTSWIRRRYKSVTTERSFPSKRFHLLPVSYLLLQMVAACVPATAVRAHSLSLAFFIVPPATICLQFSGLRMRKNT